MFDWRTVWPKATLRSNTTLVYNTSKSEDKSGKNIIDNDEREDQTIRERSPLRAPGTARPLRRTHNTRQNDGQKGLRGTQLGLLCVPVAESITLSAVEGACNRGSQRFIANTPALMVREAHRGCRHCAGCRAGMLVCPPSATRGGVT